MAKMICINNEANNALHKMTDVNGFRVIMRLSIEKCVSVGMYVFFCIF